MSEDLKRDLDQINECLSDMKMFLLRDPTDCSSQNKEAAAEALRLAEVLSAEKLLDVDVACTNESAMSVDCLAEFANKRQAGAMQKHPDEVVSESHECEDDDKVVIVLPSMSLSKAGLT